MLEELRIFFTRQTTETTTSNTTLCLKGFTNAMFDELNEHAAELGLPEWYGGVRYVFFHFTSVLASNFILPGTNSSAIDLYFVTPAPCTK